VINGKRDYAAQLKVAGLSWVNKTGENAG
jgi:hypothetical protein